MCVLIIHLAFSVRVWKGLLKLFVGVVRQVRIKMCIFLIHSAKTGWFTSLTNNTSHFLPTYFGNTYLEGQLVENEPHLSCHAFTV